MRLRTYSYTTYDQKLAVCEQDWKQHSSVRSFTSGIVFARQSYLISYVLFMANDDRPEPKMPSTGTNSNFMDQILD